ncbi:MAG: citrate/2-methylcitrate synthase [Acidobacteriota bacterium]
MKSDTPINTLDIGLANVPVCTSNISFTTVGNDGKPILMYRGFSIYDLIKSGFEEIVYLILYNHLPNRDQLDRFCTKLKDNMPLNREILDHIESYPRHAQLMDLTLTTFSYARMWDEDYTNDVWRHITGDTEQRSRFLLDTGIRMGAKIPAIFCYGYRHLNGRKFIAPERSLSYAGNILNMLGVDPDEDASRALNTTLILYLDHTINCSTFSALVAESSGVDPYGPYIAASVALKGVLHGGANDLAAAMFNEVDDPKKARQYILDKLKNKEIVFGFGHRLAHYKGTVESRVNITENLMRPLAEKRNMGHLLEIYDTIKETMMREKDRAPNLDFPVALLYRVLGLPTEINTPVFQASRHFGWVANVRRQRDDGGPLYRPKQKYTGPGLDDMRTYIPLDERE